MNKFLYLDTEIKNIQDKQYFCVYVLEISRKIVFKIYKQYTKELEEKLKNINVLQDITKNTFFVIKRDGKISLDINI